ncbi:MAG: restriction endonuclease [Actinobacteria bacterium]|nr:restriction endonuclease [Actinomycetota bacterium]MBU4205691.1 restriction endonuclease [Actinomycetota bacterium]MBU4410231.1 restriction endonuclease [Actinomycetota bacterium]MBU4415653.1 restriction endonuclease [Actinomycetota bacterium]
MRALIDRTEAERRLGMIFPRTAFDTVLSSTQAGMGIAAMLYVGAVVDDESPSMWARPTMVLWQHESVITNHGSTAERMAWRKAAARGHKQLQELLDSWGEPHKPAYRDTSRETLRDETFKKWNELGAVRKLTGLPTSSSKGRWALETHFADLFDPALQDDALDAAVEAWIGRHMEPGQRLRALQAHALEEAAQSVSLTLPNGDTRRLEPGLSSQIIKSVVEVWAAKALGQPLVLTISEPGTKLFVGDQKVLSAIGLALDVNNILPDALIADLGADPVEFWIIEAVATDGPITDSRREDLLDWAKKQGIKPANCRFLTAFQSRGAAIAKRRLKDLGTGTFAWFMDEPRHALRWDVLWPDA